MMADPRSGPLTRDLPGTGGNTVSRDETSQRGAPRVSTVLIRLRQAHRHRYNQGMSATEKLAISLPKDLIEKLRRAKDEGRIDSVSGHIAELLRRDDQRDQVLVTDVEQRLHVRGASGRFEQCAGVEDPAADHPTGLGPTPSARRAHA